MMFVIHVPFCSLCKSALIFRNQKVAKPESSDELYPNELCKL